MEAVESFVVSHEQQVLEAEALLEWELALALGSTSEKTCTSINVYNGVPVVPMSLTTKESRFMISKLMGKNKDRVYELHRMILILYAPSVLHGAVGTMCVRLINRDSGETISVVDSHPVSQAATFVCRWPRAVLARGAGLALLAAVDGVTTRRGSLVGVLTPYWEDKLSTKMVYEKQLPALVYPLEEQEPAYYIKDMKRLRSLVYDRVHLGGKGIDMEEQTISLAHQKAKTQGPAGPSSCTVGEVGTVEQAFPTSLHVQVGGGMQLDKRGVQTRGRASGRWKPKAVGSENTPVSVVIHSTPDQPRP